MQANQRPNNNLALPPVREVWPDVRHGNAAIPVLGQANQEPNNNRVLPPVREAWPAGDALIHTRIYQSPQPNSIILPGEMTERPLPQSSQVEKIVAVSKRMLPSSQTQVIRAHIRSTN